MVHVKFIKEDFIFRSTHQVQSKTVSGMLTAT